MQRGTLGGISANERAYHASERLEALPLRTEIAEVVLRPVEIDDQHVVAFVCKGQILFFVGSNDVDKEESETLDEASHAALRNLDDALKARVAQRSWSVIRSGIFFSGAGLLVLIFVWVGIWRIHYYLAKFLRKHELAFSESLVVFGFNILPGLFAILRSVIRLAAFLLTLAILYLWVALSFQRFPYTEPWGNQAGTFVIDLLRELVNRVVHALPGLLAVFLIFCATQWLVRLFRSLFEQIATSRINIPWMDADVARATQRIFAVAAYTFAIVVAYPYFPGSQTDAFKGITVFFWTRNFSQFHGDH